jgi:uncharacterized membrane protein
MPVVNGTTKGDPLGDVDQPTAEPVTGGPTGTGESHGPREDHHHLAAVIEKALQNHLTEHLSRVEHVVASHMRGAAATGRQGLDTAVRFCTPAWLRPTQGEARWPVMLAVIAAIGLQLAVPQRLTIPPHWLLPVLEGVLLVILTVANPKRINHERRWLRVTSLALVGVASIANTYSAGRLIWRLVHGQEGSDASSLLVIGGAVWLTNVIIFALWYWEFDRGGPASRAHARRVYPDFQFPQMLTPDATHPDWEPTFVDYFYLSFTNATAFSPTDTMPMTRWAKMTMLSQSAVSLATVALVIARAVNIFK